MLVLHSTVQYSTVQYSTVQYSVCTGAGCAGGLLLPQHHDRPELRHQEGRQGSQHFHPNTATTPITRLNSAIFPSVSVCEVKVLGVGGHEPAAAHPHVLGAPRPHQDTEGGQPLLSSPSTDLSLHSLSRTCWRPSASEAPPSRRCSTSCTSTSWAGTRRDTPRPSSPGH